MTGQESRMRGLRTCRQVVCGMLVWLVALAGAAPADEEASSKSRISEEEVQALSALAALAFERDSAPEPQGPLAKTAPTYRLAAASQQDVRSGDEHEEKPAPDHDEPVDEQPAPAEGILDMFSKLDPTALTLSGAELDVEVVSDTVIIRGSEQDVAMLELLIDMMDESYERKELRVVTVTQRDANEIAKSVEESLQKVWDYPNQREEDKISVTAMSSSIILVSALPDQIEIAVDLIKQVDEITDELKFEQLVFPLKHRRATDVAEQLTEIVGKIREKQGARGAEQEIQIIPNDANNSLLIIAPEKQREQLQRLISEIDVEPVPGWGEVKLTLYPLLHSEADKLADVITELLQAPQGRDAAEEAVFRRLSISRATPDGEIVDLPPIELDKPTRILADDGTNSLIVATVEENIVPMGELIRLLDDVPLAEDFHVQLFPLLFADAEKMKDILDSMFDDGAKLTEEPDGTDAGGVPEGPDGKALVYKIAIAADVRTNTLLVSGREEQMRLVRTVIEQLDRPSSDIKFPLRLLALEHADATRVGKLIETLIEKRIESLEAVEVDGAALEHERVFLSVDIPTNSLIVSACDENFLEILGIVEQLDTAPAAVFETIRVVRCERLSATELKDEIDELWQRKSDLRGEFEVVDDAPVIVADERSNALLVASSREDYEEIKRLVDALETQPLTDDTRLFELKFADAVVLAGMLDELFDGLKGQIDSFEAPTIIPDLRSNALIVAASRDAMERMEELVTRLDVEGGRQTATLEVYALKYGSAVNLANRMQELFDERQQGQGEDRTPIVLMPDEASNSLICSASRDDHVVVVELLGLLDRPSTLARQFEIFPLQNGKATQVADKLQAIFESQAQGDAGRADAIATEADERTNSVIVWASPSQMENVAQVIYRLDTASPTVERTVKLVQLKQALAEDFAQMLEETIVGDSPGADDEEAIIVSFLQRRDDGTEVLRKLIRQDIKITPDPRTNSLMVMAPADSMDMLESLIQDFDRIRPVQSELRLFPLMNADSETMAEQLAELFDVEGGAGGEEVQSQLFLGGEFQDIDFARVGQELRFASDVRTNTLIAAGAEIDLRMVEELVRYLDSQEVDERVVTVMQANYRSAQELADAVRGFNEQERDILGDTDDETSQRVLRDRQIAIESLGDEEEGSSSLIVGTSRSNYTRTMEMLTQLDRPEPQVRLSVLIAEVKLSDDMELGVEIAGQQLHFSENAVLGPNGIIQGPSFDVVAGSVLGAIASGSGFNFTVTGEDFGFLLHALQADSRLEILSRPVLLVRNGDEGKINVSDSIPVVGQTRLSDTGQTQSTIDREDVGIVLTATPNISPDGYVTIMIEQEVSSFSGENLQLTEGVSSPVISEAKVNTNVTVRDGETVIIGGLITTRVSEGTSRVPLLGDIPLLGWLFRSTGVSESKTELLMVLTVDILEGFEEVEKMSRDELERFSMPPSITQSPLMEGLRITPDEALLGPQKPDRNGEGQPAPGEATKQAPAPRYGPKPKTYGPTTITRPTTTTTAGAAPAPVYGPKIARREATGEEVQP
jgi:type II secretion system protein D